MQTCSNAVSNRNMSIRQELKPAFKAERGIKIILDVIKQQKLPAFYI